MVLTFYNVSPMSYQIWRQNYNYNYIEMEFNFKIPQDELLDFGEVSRLDLSVQDGAHLHSSQKFTHVG